MKKFILPIIIIFISLIGLKIFTMTPERWKADLLSPMGQMNLSNKSNQTPVLVATPNPPKTFKFDASTDLKKELDSVNPQVLDSDFN